MNPNDRKRSLFDKYINNQLSPEEISKLKEIIDHSNDEELNEQLLQQWNSYSYTGKQQIKARKQIAGNLKDILQTDSKSTKRSFPVWGKVAAVFIGLLISYTTYLYMDKKHIHETLLSEYTVQVGNGEKATVVLPDGSKIYLNSQSHLSYPASFGHTERNVKFSGEGYFEITRNEKVPFTVSNPAATVKVLGTVFNFYATSNDEWFETTLIEGKVEVTLNMPTPHTTILQPNQKIRYNKRTGQWNVSTTDLWDETAWKRGDLIFRSKTFGDIVCQLETYYGVTIHMEGNLPDKLFTGSFHENDINAVLLNLQQHYDFAYSKTGNTIEIQLN